MRKNTIYVDVSELRRACAWLTRVLIKHHYPYNTVLLESTGPSLTLFAATRLGMRARVTVDAQTRDGDHIITGAVKLADIKTALGGMRGVVGVSTEWAPTGPRVPERMQFGRTTCECVRDPRASAKVLFESPLRLRPPQSAVFHDWREAMGAVLPYVCDDASRPALDAVLCDTSGALYATNGHQLARVPFPENVTQFPVGALSTEFVRALAACPVPMNFCVAEEASVVRGRVAVHAVTADEKWDLRYAPLPGEKEHEYPHIGSLLPEPKLPAFGLAARELGVLKQYAKGGSVNPMVDLVFSPHDQTLSAEVVGGGPPIRIPLQYARDSFNPSPMVALWDEPVRLSIPMLLRAAKAFKVLYFRNDGGQLGPVVISGSEYADYANIRLIMPCRR